MSGTVQGPEAAMKSPATVQRLGWGLLLAFSRSEYGSQRGHYPSGPVRVLAGGWLGLNLCALTPRWCLSPSLQGPVILKRESFPDLCSQGCLTSARFRLVWRWGGVDVEKEQM